MAKKERRGLSKQIASINNKRRLPPTTQNLLHKNASYVNKSHKTNDPNIILINLRSPIKQLVNFILSRLDASLAQSEQVEDNTPQIHQPIYLLGANTAISRVVSILEIVKRRRPTCLYSIDLGLFADDSTSIISPSDQATQPPNDSEQTMEASKDENTTSTTENSSDSSQTLSNQRTLSYAIKITIVPK